MELILVRHGETEWNKKEIFRGRADIPLNETGIKQAGLLSRYLSSRRIDAIFSSPLRRARQTAEVIAEPHKLSPEIAANLIDLDYGNWQGLSNLEVPQKYPELYRLWMENPERVTMPGGESLSDVRKRALEVVEDILACNLSTVVIVSHRVVNKVLICALLGRDNSHFWNIRQDTAAITTFNWDGRRYVLISYNDTSYLKPIEKAPAVDF